MFKIPEVVKTYDVFPAAEQTKLLIIEKLRVLFDCINILFQNKLQNRKDDEIVSLTKSTTISLYLMLKPKLIEWINRKTIEKEETELVKEIKKMISKIEGSIANPSSLTIEDALYYADALNIFCHEYGVTKITYFAGTKKTGDDIYEV